MRANSYSLLLVLIFAIPAIASRTLTASGQDETQRFHRLLDREWEWRLAQDPLFATSVGRSEYNHLLPDVSEGAWMRRLTETRAYLVHLHAIDRSQLSPSDRINYDMFERELELRVEWIAFRDYEIPLNADSGFHTGFARLPSSVPLMTERDFDAYVSRLNAFRSYVESQIDNMRAGMARGMTLPRVVLQGIEASIGTHVVDSYESSVFYAPLRELPASVGPESGRRLRSEAAAAIMNSVVPGYREFLGFMMEEYIPASRQTLSASDLPDGEAYYLYKIREFTTLDLTPREIHQIGLDEVRRIRKEMDDVIAATGFEGSFADFLHFLRTDTRFYAQTPLELLKEASYIAKRMDGKLPMLFKTVPRLPYGVEPVPDDLAPKYTTGRYVEAPEGTTQPGYYWVNTYKLESRPLYNMEALTLHEAVPGHHLQIALNRELEDLPAFRRYSYISAFGEGWGLYAEWLGLEAGFYKDPYSNFGRLTYEMWRACRLVVDTGLHAFGWTRQQTMDYLAENTALPLHEIQTETDRYISWPGQALAYKLGELKIKELRRYAESVLGPDFDVREFHDAVLLNGSVPLTVLDERVKDWVAKRAN